VAEAGCDIATIGITDFAQGELSDIVYVEITALGKTIKREEPLGTIEAVKAVSDLYSPVSGQVIAANDALKDSPANVNKDPTARLDGEDQDYRPIRIEESCSTPRPMPNWPASPRTTRQNVE